MSEREQGPIRVVVVDDQALVRMGLRTLLESESDTELVDEICLENEQSAKRMK